MLKEGFINFYVNLSNDRNGLLISSYKLSKVMQKEITGGKINQTEGIGRKAVTRSIYT